MKSEEFIEETSARKTRHRDYLPLMLILFPSDSCLSVRGRSTNYCHSVFKTLFIHPVQTGRYSSLFGQSIDGPQKGFTDVSAVIETMTGT